MLIFVICLCVCSSVLGQEKDTTIEIVRNSFRLKLSYHSSSKTGGSSSSRLIILHFNLSNNILIQAEKNNLASDRAVLNLHFDTTNCKLISIDFHKKSSLTSLNNEIQATFNEIIQVYNDQKLYLYNDAICSPETKVILNFKLY